MTRILCCYSIFNLSPYVPKNVWCFSASNTSCGHRGLRVVGQDTRAVFVCSIEVGPDGMPPEPGDTTWLHRDPWDPRSSFVGFMGYFWGFNMIEPGKIWGDNSNSGSVSIPST